LTPRLIALAFLCCLAAPAVASAQSPTVHSAAVARTSLHRAQRILSTRGKVARSRAVDLSPVLARLAVTLPALPPSERRRARRLLERPTDGASDPQNTGYAVPEATPFCSAHFCIHWVATTADAPPLADGNGNGVPDFVEQADAVAENSFAVENDRLGWRTAKSDGTRGGDHGKTDIYLAQLGGTGLYGYTAVDPDQQILRSDHSGYSYMVIDNDFQASEFPGYSSPTIPLEVTVAHEYNHVLQYTYDVLEQAWMNESTAVWAEGKVYPEVFDYLQYLGGWAQLTAVPITTFNGNDPNDRTNIKVYGSTVWNKWLDARYGEAIVRRAWEDSLKANPKSFAPAAYDLAIRQFRGPGFSSEFDRFAAATAEWQAQNSGFPDGARYPDVARAGTLAVNGGAAGIRLNHTTYALVNVAAGGAARIRLGISVPSGTAGAVALVGRTGASPGGRATVVLKRLPAGGIGTVSLNNPARFTRITGVLVNSDVKVRGFSSTLGDWVFKRDAQLLGTRVSTDFKPPRVKARSPRPGASRVSQGTSIRARFSEKVLGVSSKSFQLFVSGGGRVPARVALHGRVATLVPKRALRAHTRYRVRFGSAIGDTAFNRLAASPAWEFRTR
jgi:hypothetical protein